MNFIDYILVAIAIASFVYAVRIIMKVFPQLSNINVKTIPEAKQAEIKRQILEDKLRRDFRERWKSVRDFLFQGQGKRITGFFGKFYERLKDMEHEYRIARKKDLSSSVTRTKSIEDLLAEARDTIAQEQLNRAEQLLIECLKLDDQNVKAYTMLAQVYREKNDYEHAKETLEYILRLTNQDDPSIFSNLASLALERGDFSTAQEEYLKSIQLDPDNYRFHLDLAEVYNVMGENDKAQREAERAHALAPNNPKILDFLIENSIILQDKNRAQEFLSKMIEVNPQNGKIPSFKSQIDDLS